MTEQRDILATNDVAIVGMAVRVMQSCENERFLAKLVFAPVRTAGSAAAFSEGVR